MFSKIDFVNNHTDAELCYLQVIWSGSCQSANMGPVPQTTSKLIYFVKLQCNFTFMKQKKLLFHAHTSLVNSDLKQQFD